MEKLTIDRSKWRTGEESAVKTGKGSTYLLNSEGFMCCLGFEALRLKFSKEDIICIGEPCEITTDFHDNKFITKAIDINDDSIMSLEDKEKYLIPLFKGVDVELEFINEPTYE